MAAWMIAQWQSGCETLHVGSFCISFLSASFSSCNGKLQTFSSCFENPRKAWRLEEKSTASTNSTNKKEQLWLSAQLPFFQLIEKIKEEVVLQAPVQLWDDSGSGGKPAPLGIAKSEVNVCHMDEGMRGWDSSASVAWRMFFLFFVFFGFDPICLVDYRRLSKL